MQVNFGMQEVNNQRIGIGIFARHLITELVQYPDLTCSGHAFLTWHTRPQSFSRFPFPTKISLIPARWMYSPHRSLLPVSMRRICRSSSDIYLYFNYKLPRARLDGKVISTIHDLIPLKTEMENQSVKADYLAYIRDAISRSDDILTVSECSKRDILTYFPISEERIHVIPNGVDFARFHTPFHPERLKEVRKKYHLPEKFILYFGSSRKHKNVTSVLKSYAKVQKAVRDSVKLVITNGSEPLRQLAGQLGIESDVRFTDAVDDRDKAAFYQLASIKLFVSLYEGFGIPVLEAMAAGTPVIASNVSALPEISGDAAWLVDPLDTDGIAFAVESVLADDALRQDMIQKGFLNAKAWSWRRAGEKLHACIMHLND
ncbi:glycosyltransferase family 1 protein [Sporolactobacillus sp. Y61]|uniref:Glycosyltransferase family 1 protein n=1 Tax=Sporolactobacillus sp. Y61 TaxID=3160863 RepID=A0AAU8II39_9BACL